MVRLKHAFKSRARGPFLGGVRAFRLPDGLRSINYTPALVFWERLCASNAVEETPFSCKRCRPSTALYFTFLPLPLPHLTPVPLPTLSFPMLMLLMLLVPLLLFLGVPVGSCRFQPRHLSAELLRAPYGGNHPVQREDQRVFLVHGLV